MTADEIFILARTNGIVLEVQGDRLVVDAPTGALTPELRAELARHKPALVALLAPVTEFVTLRTLRGGLTVPRPAFELALDLERRGFRQALDADEQVTIEPQAALTDADRAAIQRWRLHLGALVSSQCDVLA